jgi:hypothetical protein
LPRRVLEWFWRGRTLAALRAVPEPSLEVTALERRAAVAAESARKALRPDAPYAHGPADALAADLYAQSIRWSLAALRSAGEPPDEPDATLELGFLELAELEQKTLAELVAKRKDTAERLLAILGRNRQNVSRARSQRTLRAGMLVLLVVAVLLGSLLSHAWVADSRDLAFGKAWTASSRFGVYGCRSPEQVCEGSPHFFFHTNEENEPWIAIDLGAMRQVSSVQIENRRDCCRERAVPLVVEVSRDNKKWTQVAQRTEEFSFWEGTFSRTRARWVRVKIKGTATLHLARVRVLP